MEETIDEKVMLSLVLDEKNTIQAYARYGYFENATQWTGTLPEDFEGTFKPSFYLLKNNEIVENPNYVAPKPPTDSPSNLEKRVAAISYQQMADSQTISVLQKQDAQMAYQIMTGGKQ